MYLLVDNFGNLFKLDCNIFCSIAILQQNAPHKLFAGIARSLDTLLVSARMRPCVIPAARQVTWLGIALHRDLMRSYATIVLSLATLLLTAPMNGHATTAVSLDI
jgi:hypothetical protein